MLTKNGLSTGVSATEVLISLVVFVALYGVLGITAFVLMLRHVRRGLDPVVPLPDHVDAPRVPELTY